MNVERFYVTIVFGDRVADPVISIGPVKSRGWQCGECGEFNAPGRQWCWLCSEPRP